MPLHPGCQWVSFWEANDTQWACHCLLNGRRWSHLVRLTLMGNSCPISVRRGRSRKEGKQWGNVVLSKDRNRSRTLESPERWAAWWGPWWAKSSAAPMLLYEVDNVNIPGMATTHAIMLTCHHLMVLTTAPWAHRHHSRRQMGQGMEMDGKLDSMLNAQWTLWTVQRFAPKGPKVASS